MRTLGIIMCSNVKRRDESRADELYCSARFRRDRAVAETNYDAFYVASGRHGLLHPSDVVAPYNFTLDGASAQVRTAWRDRIAAQLRSVLAAGSVDRVFVHASGAYLDGVINALGDLGYEAIDEPPRDGLTVLECKK
jgi:hypothetical protein